MNFIHWPSEGTEGWRLCLGGKARALAALQGRGENIPGWFVVLPGAFAESVPSEIARKWTLSPDVAQQLQSALDRLGPAGGLFAVRSSALEEDGTGHSFAGQFDSFLEVRREDVAAQVVAVWRSGFSERVRHYQERQRLPVRAAAPAVLIQRMVHAEAAGVGFGLDPVTGRPGVTVVSAVRGLGDTLVSGERNADTWRVAANAEVISRQIAEASPVLTDSQVVEVAAMVQRLGAFFGRPQDVEWAWEKDTLYLLQSRPVTSEVAAETFNLWDNSNIIESYSGVTTPLTFSFARRAYEGVYRQFCQILAVPPAKIRAHATVFRDMIGLIQGRVYYNLLNWYRVLALLPGFTLNRRFMEQMMGVKEELPAEILAELGPVTRWSRVRDSWDLAGTLGTLVAHHFLLPRKIRRFQKRLNAALAPPGKDLEAMTAGELAGYFRELEARLLTRWDAPLLNDFFAMIFFGVLRRLSTGWLADAEGTLGNSLLCAEGGMISAEPARRVTDLAALAARHPILATALNQQPAAAIEAMLPEFPDFSAAYRAYLDKFGERCLEELKLETQTLHDDPLLLLRAVGQLAGAASTPVVPIGHTEIPEDRRTAESKVREALRGHPIRGAVFRWVLRHTRARVRDRENLRFERTRLFGRVRRLFVQLGRRFHAAGHLDDPRDVFHLEVDEVLAFAEAGALAGRLAPTDLRTRVHQRQREFADYRVAAPPPRRFSSRGDAKIPATWQVAADPSTPATGETRQGLGCCPGVVRGRVRKVLDPRNTQLRRGEILVAERTDPGWILIFPSAAGLLIERGSLLSHSAIVARELGIPAVVAIDGLTQWLQDGDAVEFDGRTGRVRRLTDGEATFIPARSES